MWEDLLRLDAGILLWIQDNVRNEYLTPVMTFITHLGDSGWFWIVLAVLLFLVRKTRMTALLMGVSLLGSLLINNILLKNLVARTRPYEAVPGLHRIIEAQSDLSFPSGHAGSSFAAAMVIFFLCKKAAGIPAVALAFLIAVSRLYVGVHYPSDVLAGMITGTAIAFAVCKAYRIRQRKGERKAHPRKRERNKKAMETDGGIQK